MGTKTTHTAEVTFDASVAGFTPADFADMDEDERLEAIEDLENRAHDLRVCVGRLRLMKGKGLY